MISNGEFCEQVVVEWDDVYYTEFYSIDLYSLRADEWVEEPVIIEFPKVPIQAVERFSKEQIVEEFCVDSYQLVSMGDIDLSIDGGGIIIHRAGTPVRVFDVQGAGILPGVGLSQRSEGQWRSPLVIGREIEVHRLVVESGRHNFEGCRIPVFSRLNIGEWRARSSTPEEQLVVDFLEYGWPIGYERAVWPVSPLVNHKGALEFADEVDRYLEREVGMGAMLGPFEQNPLCLPLCVSALNTVPKGTSERRVIADLSWPHDCSINAGIPKDSYIGFLVQLAFPSVDSVCRMIQAKGQKCHIYKRDMSRGYKQLPVDPGDVHFLGYAWGSRLFIDRTAVMGLRSAALMCQSTTSVIIAWHRREGYMSTNFLDDLIGVDEPEKAEEADECLGALMEASGIEEKASKHCRPAPEVEVLGVLFNTISMTMSVTPERLVEIKSLVCEWLRKKKSNRKALESLIGKLVFVSKCVHMGRVFITRLLDALKGLEGREGSFDVEVELKRDLRWWKAFLVQFNGVSVIPDMIWTKPDTILASDACLTGGGAVNWERKEFFHFTFPPDILSEGHHISRLELIVLTMAVKVWGQFLRGRRVGLKCDNEACVWVVNSGRCDDEVMLAWLRELAFVAADSQCVVKCEHIRGTQNRVPDLLSRWDTDVKYVQEFCQLTDSEWREVVVDRTMFVCANKW